MILLLRHGEPNWASVNERGWRGAANDFAALTPLGVQQAAAAADLVADRGVAAILSSPMTRALQTAGIVATRLGLPVQVELDLREWNPDETYQWTEPAAIFAAYADMLAHDGVRPAGNDLLWEPLAAVRERTLAVVSPYLSDEVTALAVCHGVVIQALTGHRNTGHACLRELAADSDPDGSAGLTGEPRRPVSAMGGPDPPVGAEHTCRYVHRRRGEAVA